MQSVQAFAVFVVCYILHCTTGQNPATQFTQAPPRTVSGILGYDVTFHWTFSFAVDKDWKDFTQIYWGMTDNAKRVTDKYMTVFKDGRAIVNYQLKPLSLQSRLGVIKNISKDRCIVDFVLKNVTRRDANLAYGCTATVFGNPIWNGPIYLVLRVPPSFTLRSNSTMEVEEGKHVNLRCGATGDPVPLIQWKRQRELLQSSKRTANLSITKVKLKNGGIYTCTAKNTGGSTSYSVLVRVTRYRPYIDNITSSKVVKSWLGHAVILKCIVDANPAATFTWYKDGRSILRDVNSTHNNSTLSIKPNKSDQFGSYLCKAVNIKGTTLHNITVEQLYPPGPPVITERIPDMLSISVSWAKPLNDGGKMVLDYKIVFLDVNKKEQKLLKGITGNAYTLQDLRQNRNYTIIIYARNDVGYGKPANVTISTLEAARPVILFIATAPSLMSVHVWWNSTNNNTGVKILDYRVMLIDTVTQEERNFSKITALSLYINNLKHNRTYLIKVQAENDDGYGRFKIKAFKTLEADPPGPPVIKAFPRVFELKITWNSSIQDISNIEILDYRIKVWDGSLLVQKQDAITGRSLVIKNLSRNKTYVIGIQARNEAGYGQMANITSRTILEGPPDAPTITNITIQENYFLIRWTEPYNGESPIKLYTVTVWLISAVNNSHQTERPISRNTTETKLSLKFKWNKTYQVAVSAWNIHGQSFCRTPKIFTTRRPGSSSTVATASPKATPATHTQEQSTKSHTIDQDQTVKAKSDKVENDKNIFIYLAPLWIVIAAFGIPSVLFVVWKAAKKITHVQTYKQPPKSRRARQYHNRDSESSVTTMADVTENKRRNHYESITAIFEMNHNYGYNAHDEQNLQSPNSLNINGDQESKPYEYNHLHETSWDKTEKPKTKIQIGLVNPSNQGENELESGQGGMSPNHFYSHLIHSGRQTPVSNEYSTIPVKCKWEISRRRLRLDSITRCWQFGPVKKGFVLNVDQNGHWIPVTVKILSDKGKPNEQGRKDLLSELEILKSLPAHNHVIQLLACVTESEPFCIITEFTPYGDLLGFLRKKRGLEDAYYNTERLPRRSVTSHQLMQFAWEIADGMAHLSSAKIVHRDLAARNVLLGENLTCKITDFATSRDMGLQDMCQRQNGGRLPVKWTALEALLDDVYTTKSDVWSFGVVLFEIVTMGGDPYPGIEVLDLIHRLASGYRIEKPMHVSEQVYDVMLSCWHEVPNTRPTFRELQNSIAQLDKENQNCINLRAYDGGLYESVQPLSR
ncbi:uncharacterized protein LOC141891999 isoform X2 [Acropora palmata]|uniref:uncharacterized protein LOC141891999 isoform X2 n=1 Tax=Acropora palmata TaxID=6131 RepID=UPI003DA0658E